ncbi:hypothetical protein E3P98_04091 [Wallemia ichthyophaga]|nr:hypothetical protein E3P98_04091 [Wallemia ichthyophaga]
MASLFPKPPKSPKPPTDKALRRWVSTDSLHSSRYAWPFLAKPRSTSNLHAIQTLKLVDKPTAVDAATGEHAATPPPTPTRRTPHKKFIRPSQPFYHRVNEYVGRFKGLVKLEQQASEHKFNNRMHEWPLDKLKQEGYVITDLSACHARRKWGKPSAIFQLNPGHLLPSHRFRKGETVTLSELSELSEVDANANANASDVPRKWSGTVDSVSPTHIQLLFDRRVPITADARYRIDMALADVLYKRSLEALESLCLDPVEQAKVSDSALKGTHLCDVILNTGNSANTTNTNYQGIFANDCWMRSWALRYSRADPLAIEGDPELSLNARQIQAVALMIGNRASLIQGPPGTGKTATISHSIALMKQHFHIPHPILIAAYTNVATDNIASILSAAGMKITRLGHVSRVAPELHTHTLAAQVEAHPRYTHVKHARYRSEGLFRRAASTNSTANATSSLMKEQLYEEARQQRRTAGRIVREMQQDIIRNADVVCATCIGGNARELSSVDFPIVFIDEASQATEPTTLIPLMKGCSHMSIIGDHKQLAPIITSEEASRQGLSVSLFERLIETSSVPSVMLDVQYRMHPDLSSIPNTIFYDSQLVDGCMRRSVDASNGGSSGHLLPAYTPPRSAYLRDGAALAFVNHEHTETRDGESTLNEGEAGVIMGLVTDLFKQNMDIRGCDIGIVSPYVAQTLELLHLLNRDAHWRRQFEGVLGAQRLHELADIEVKTVDGFEGREKQVIILSLTRSNERGFIGFLDDPRRANVGLTRAKRCLMVAGNASTLVKGVVGAGRESALWRDLIGLCRSKGAYVEYDECRV